MNKERLMRLVQLLRDNANNPTGAKFDLSFWGEIPPAEWGKKSLEEGSVVPLTCNTTGCALGLAAISGKFQAEGLTWKSHGGVIEPAFEGRTGFEAGMAFFDLSYDEATGLFDPSYYAGVIQGAEAELKVAKRIKDFVNGVKMDVLYYT
jgi:hypothetical protein